MRDIHYELVLRCKQGERAAQKELYGLYCKQMFNVSLRILNDSQEAEDVLQESFIDAFVKLESFRMESTFGAWFKRIVVNKSINALKKRKYKFEDTDKIADTPEEEPEESQLKYTVQHIKEAMMALPAGFRTVFSLYLFEDYSHQEIAQELSISVGTSKSQLSRAKLKVQDWLMSNVKTA